MAHKKTVLEWGGDINKPYLCVDCQSDLLATLGKFFGFNKTNITDGASQHRERSERENNLYKELSQVTEERDILKKALKIVNNENDSD